MYCGYIYQIVADGIDKVYFGSTTLTLKHRFQKHSQPSNKCSSRELFNFPNVRIEKIEECFNDDKALLKKEIVEIEREYIERCRMIKPDMWINITIPSRTQKEWAKEYSITHKEQISHTQSIYQKKYREANKEKIRADQQLDYINNREKIKARSKARRDAKRELKHTSS